MELYYFTFHLFRRQKGLMIIGQNYAKMTTVQAAQTALALAQTANFGTPNRCSAVTA